MPPTTAVRARRIVLPRGGVTVGRAAPTAADPSAEFSEYVRSKLDGPVLRYSQRLELVKVAERCGIGRFEANLVIASVLHREGRGQEYEMAPENAGWLAPLLTAVVLQGVIVAGAWWVLG
jgi:hypothetical protein